MMPVNEPHRLALPVGFKIEHFRIEAVLGKGGFGITYLAVDRQLGKRVAIKELLPDTIATRAEGLTVVPHSADMQENWEWARERFLEEARALSAFSHPAIVGVHRLIEANGTVYMVMDYVEGESYEARLQRMGVDRSERSLLAIIDPILLGLEEVHSKNLLHRDIKPDNILIDKRGRPVLIDFGSARELVGKTTTMTSIVTHGYSPLEQYQTRGKVGPWTDLYAVGAVMCRAITGQKPPAAPDRVDEDAFQWLTYNTMTGHREELRLVIDWMLRVRGQDRPQSVSTVRACLAADLVSDETDSRTDSITYKMESASLRKQTTVADGGIRRIAPGRKLFARTDPPLPRFRPNSKEEPLALRQAAEKGDDQAANSLGRLYFNGWGHGIDVDYKEAHRWTLQAARSGVPDALRRLSSMFQNGWGVVEDKAVAQQCAQAAEACAELLKAGKATRTNVDPILRHLNILWSPTA
jgi:serine/threonine protein kinase